MMCPKCHNNTRVFYSLPTLLNNSVYRRRECLVCKERFSTEEKVRLINKKLHQAAACTEI